jgi:hypothetical protein
MFPPLAGLRKREWSGVASPSLHVPQGWPAFFGGAERRNAGKIPA